MTYYSTKTYGHNIDYLVFRQLNDRRTVIYCTDIVYNLNLHLVVMN